MVDNEKKEKFIELRASGMSFEKISKQLDISKPTLLKFAKEFRSEVERLHFIHLEAMAEKYKMLKIARIEAFGKLLEQVEVALDSADFKSMAPEKLVELKLKLNEKIQQELSDSFTIEKNIVHEMLDKEQDYILKVD